LCRREDSTTTQNSSSLILVSFPARDLVC
jgi:hypothetical protein